MALQFKNQSQVQEQQKAAPRVEYQVGWLNIPLAPQGMPLGVPAINRVSRIVRMEPPPIAMPGSNLKRALNYYADYGGCGFWRMVWPENLLNAYQKAIINGLTTMVLDERFYAGIEAVRLQRQATPMQLKFVEFLKQHQKNHGFKIIYEVDDIIFKEDIPDFNRCKEAFDNEEILRSAKEMMAMSDEMTVTCEYMKNYYRQKTGNQKITVIPNYPPKFWFAGLYNKERLIKLFELNKDRPRVGYCGSGTHIDVINKTNQNDDFAHVVDHIIATRKKFKWVFMGCFPLRCKPFIDSGEMEYHDWKSMLDYPQGIYDLGVNATIAPLQTNNFNRAKSNIKYLEVANLGIPCVCQDLETYASAPSHLRFTTGQDLIDKLDNLFKDINSYIKTSDHVYKYAQTMYLNDHLDEYLEAYFSPYADKGRKALLVNNPEQAITINV